MTIGSLKESENVGKPRALVLCGLKESERVGETPALGSGWLKSSENGEDLSFERRVAHFGKP